jgi:hypothetical protein
VPSSADLRVQPILGVRSLGFARISTGQLRSRPHRQLTIYRFSRELFKWLSTITIEIDLS